MVVIPSFGHYPPKHRQPWGHLDLIEYIPCRHRDRKVTNPIRHNIILGSINQTHQEQANYAILLSLMEKSNTFLEWICKLKATVEIICCGPKDLGFTKSKGLVIKCLISLQSMQCCYVTHKQRTDTR